jgi:hypothetical protein
MRGKLPTQSSMFYAIDVERRVRADHPLRPIKRMVDEELTRMSGLFEQAYTRDNGPGRRCRRSGCSRPRWDTENDGQAF